MKIICLFIFLTQHLFIYGQSVNHSPLSAYSTEWNKAEYNKCNTASGITYLSTAEKELIYILNLVRSNPLLFVNTVLAKYPSVSEKEYLLKDKKYYNSLIKMLGEMAPQNLFDVDKLCYESAFCHAVESGKKGYTGHDRLNKTCEDKRHYMGECCDYGNSEPLEIVLSLLIDEDVPSFGHRKILLGNYTQIGLSIRPHKTYETNTVIDLW
jgi:hypothetical protein